MSQKLFSLCAVILGCSLLLGANEATACSCLPPSVETSFNQASDALVVSIERRIERRSKVYFVADVIHAFKGCHERVILRTEASTSMCGVPNLAEVGDEVLVFGHDQRTMIRNLPVLDINGCDYNRHTDEVTFDDWYYLFTNAQECIAPTCEDLSDLDLGLCRMLLGYGVVGDSCEAIGGCYRPDWLNLFSSQQACESSCMLDDGGVPHPQLSSGPPELSAEQ